MNSLRFLGLSPVRRALAVLGLLVGLAPHGALAQATRTTGGRSTVTYPNATQVGEAIISSDPETRKIIVITDDETAAHIGQVITNLDRPVPQVLIKVVFLEVTYRKGFDFGLEGNYRKDMGNGQTSVVQQVFGISDQGSNLDPSAGLPSGAGLYQLMGSDFQMTLRAIADAGKSEILSRPSILARNNQQATITVGQQVPIIAGSTVNGVNGSETFNINYRAVGIILRVTPFITSDSLVEMIISPEISEVSTTQFTPINDRGGRTPYINSRTADTVVVTPDGQTVVIGGLMENRQSDNENKIPWLGDIPGLGALFKKRNTASTKTELLIFLTPHIVQRPSQLAGLTAQERAVNQLVPKSFSEQELDRFLQNVPPAEPKDAPKSRSRSKK